MPNTVTVSRRVKYLEFACYFLLLFFVVPIRINNGNLGGDLEEQYKSYVDRFNKTFPDDKAYSKRLQAFKTSLENIQQLNNNRTKNSSALYGLTKYSDMLPEEFVQLHLRPNIQKYFLKSLAFLTKIDDASNEKHIHNVFKRASLPLKVDWREKNAVSKVKDQKACGACWAFAVVGIAESMYAIKNGLLQQLSVQEMIDCAKNNFGCNGGDVYSLLDWIKTENVSIAREEDYPLVLSDGKCKKEKVSLGRVKILDFECGSVVNSEDIILQLLANLGPVAVAINAQSWQNYVSGTIQYHCDSTFSSLNHAVQIVGYNLDTEIPHYIVRNSWGEDFGENGYLNIAIGSNVCGLASEVCIVKVL